jgi:hypothetical protein
MARSQAPAVTIGVRVADFGTSGGEFETGWTLFESGRVRFGEATGDPDAELTEFVVTGAKLSRLIRPGLGAGATSKFLSRLLAGTQTAAIDVEVRALDKDGVPFGRGFLYQVIVPTSYSVDAFDGASKELAEEHFEFVARDVQIVRS